MKVTGPRLVLSILEVGVVMTLVAVVAGSVEVGSVERQVGARREAGAPDCTGTAVPFRLIYTYHYWKRCNYHTPRCSRCDTPSFVESPPGRHSSCDIAIGS